MAEKKAQSPAVKAFARLMVDDRVEIESRLAAVAVAEKATLPQDGGTSVRTTLSRGDRDFLRVDGAPV